jgi:hypothetical protein
MTQGGRGSIIVQKSLAPEPKKQVIQQLLIMDKNISITTLIGIIKIVEASRIRMN